MAKRNDLTPAGYLPDHGMMPHEIKTHEALETEIEQAAIDKRKLDVKQIQALSKIKATASYKYRWHNWEKYVRGRWEISREYADRLIAECEVRQKVGTEFRNLSYLDKETEDKVTKKLTEVPIDKVPEIIQRTKDMAKEQKVEITPKLVEEARDKTVPPAPKPKPNYRKEAEQIVGKLIRTLDELGLSEETFHQGPAATPLEAIEAIKYMVSGEM